MASEVSARSLERSTPPLVQDTLGSHWSPSQTGSPRSPRCILVEDVLEHLSCGLCRGPVASSLILSCSHLFCGDCLWQHLQKRQSCPTCSMALRAVPVRCLAMDKVAASIVPSLPQQQQQQYAKRSKDGQCTADKVNKMFWWLAPAALPNGGPILPAAAPPATCLPLVAAPALPGTSLASAGMSLDLQVTSSCLPGAPSRLPCPAPSPFGPLLPAMSGTAPGLPHIPPHLAVANAAASTNQLLQLAQQYATAQQMMHVQQQLGAAAALGSGAIPAMAQPIMRDAMSMSMQQMLMTVPQEQLGTARMGYHDPLQLTAMISNICQV